MSPRIDEDPQSIALDQAEAMAAHGIERIPVDYFHWNGYRYGTLKDALAAARRAQAAGAADA